MNAPSPKPRLYGRAKGRPLRAAQETLVKTLLPKISIDPAKPLRDAAPGQTVWLEIGFGGAEHLLHTAKLHPETLCIGAEPFLNGVAKALSGIEAEALSNIRLHHGDVRDVTPNIPDGALERVYVLFPDPWPKARHNKRRLLSTTFIGELARILAPGGQLCFASDITDYIDWVMVRADFEADWTFEPQAPDAWRTPYPDWPGTRYEAKAKREGRTCHYFTFTRR